MIFLSFDHRSLYGVSCYIDRHVLLYIHHNAIVRVNCHSKKRCKFCFPFYGGVKVNSEEKKAQKPFTTVNGTCTLF